MKNLVKETKIGEALSAGVTMESGEVGLFIASEDVSCGCGFRFDEWEKFVECVNKAHQKYLKLKKT